jgi:hypothetical protein
MGKNNRSPQLTLSGKRNAFFSTNKNKAAQAMAKKKKIEVTPRQMQQSGFLLINLI